MGVITLKNEGNVGSHGGEAARLWYNPWASQVYKSPIFADSIPKWYVNNTLLCMVKVQ